MSIQHHTAAVIGAGPAGLMAAEILSRAGARVTLYDRMPSAGRKFLLAGRGGLNLTHSEDIQDFIARYGGGAALLSPAISRFSPTDLRAWCHDLGQETFVGTSGRVFPASFKASPLLRAWLRRLDAAGVAFRPRHCWTGWGLDGALDFDAPDGRISIHPDATVLALGGASWPQLGSDGSWVTTLSNDGVAVAPLRPSNCGFTVPWSAPFRDKFEGHPLKGISLSFGARTIRGEATVTREGLEGGGVYALSAPLRDALDRDGATELHIGLKPDLPIVDVAARLAAARSRSGADQIPQHQAGQRPHQAGRKASLSTLLRKALKLSPVAIGLLQEAAHAGGYPLSGLSPETLAALIGAVPVTLTGAAPIARAISTAGGIAADALDAGLMLRHRPGVFAAGEMLDWEAPTGGYLLQACFATGATAGAAAAAWLSDNGERVS